MKYLYVDASGDEYPQCPLRTDLNVCSAHAGSDVNDCPSLSEDGAIWSLPNWCPLRDGGVCVEFLKHDAPNAHPHGTAVAGTVQGDVGEFN